MKCPECKGRGHFLMPMSTPTCEACGGSGEEHPVVDQLREMLPAPSPAANPWQRGDGPDPLSFRERFPGLAAWLPRGAFSPMSALVGPVAELRREQLARDEERLREAVAVYEAVARVPAYRAVGWRWDEDCCALRLDAHTAEGMEPLLVPGEYIETHYRTVYERDPHSMGHRLAAIEVREGDSWRVLRAFEDERD